MAVPKGRDRGRVYRSLAGDKPTRTIALAWNRMRYQTQLFKRFRQFLVDRAATDSPDSLRSRPSHATHSSGKVASGAGND
jgi:DNA-binding transcriptional LysR family regulator